MVLSEVTLHQFRSHHEATFEFDPKVTFICGPNGAGKTNILEAIHVLFTGKSFRDNDEDLIEFDHDWWRLEGVLDGTTRDVRYQPAQLRAKQLHIDEVNKGRLTYRQQLPVVLFEPDDLLMIHGSPSARRRYIDDCILSLQPTYRQTLNKYERTLLQRNNLLKNKTLSPAERKDNLFVWDVSLSELGAEIITRRQEMIGLLNNKLDEIYSLIAGETQTLSIVYESKSHLPPSSSTLLQELHHSLSHDVVRGMTTVGPHRDDIDFVLKGSSAKHTASRGEVRSIILSLKIAFARLVEEQHETSPVVLLDDVFSELDSVRKTKLIAMMDGYQCIITDTEQPSDLSLTKILL
jgi:DNA replication and repair protein RecF